MILSLLCLPLFFLLTRCVFNCSAKAFPDNPCSLSLLPWHLCLSTNARHPKNEIQILFSSIMFWFTAASGSIGILQSFDLKSAIDILLWPWYATRTLQDSVSTTKRHMKTFDSKNVPPVSRCHAYSRQEETLVNEKPNKAARRLVPPVYGLCVYAPLLPCARVRVWKSGKRCALVSSPALPAGSWSGSAPGPTLWSGGALRLASTHRRWGDKRGVKIRKSNFMGDKTWPVNQRTSGHVGDHDPCVQKRAALSLSLSHLLGILFPPFTDINFLLIMIQGFGVLVIIHLSTG